jgi:hypothetical protein
MSDSGTPPPPPPGPDEGRGNPYGQGDYGQMPGMPAPGYQQPGPATRPPAMDQAVMLMKVGAGLSLLGLLLTLVNRGAIRDAVEKASEDAATPMTAEQIDSAVTLGVFGGIIIGLIGVGLWLWMASANGKGKSWARILATIFFALSVLGLLGSFAQDQPAISRILQLVQVLLGAYIIFLLYKKESTAFYQASSAPRP